MFSGIRSCESEISFDLPDSVGQLSEVGPSSNLLFLVSSGGFYVVSNLGHHASWSFDEDPFLEGCHRGNLRQGQDLAHDFTLAEHVLVQVSDR